MTNDLPIQTIETTNYQFGYLEHRMDNSSHPPIVMVHGYPGRPQDFRFLFPHLPDFHCIALAMPNLDISITKTNVSTTTIRERESAILEFLDAMNIEECILMGHSMGGPLMISTTRHHPDRVKGLIIISSVGAQQYRVFRNSKPHWGYQLVRFPIIKTIFTPFMVWMFGKLGFPKGISASAMIHVLHCAHDFSFEENKGNLAAIQQPVLNIWSDNDPYVERELFEEIDGLLTNGENLIVSGGGHNPQRSEAEMVAQVLQSWILRHLTM